MVALATDTGVALTGYGPLGALVYAVRGPSAQDTAKTIGCGRFRSRTATAFYAEAVQGDSAGSLGPQYAHCTTLSSIYNRVCVANGITCYGEKIYRGSVLAKSTKLL